MTGKQSAVLWFGLALVTLRMFSSKQWSTLWGTVSKVSSATTAPTAAHSSAENGATGSLMLQA